MNWVSHSSLSFGNNNWIYDHHDKVLRNWPTRPIPIRTVESTSLARWGNSPISTAPVSLLHLSLDFFITPFWADWKDTRMDRQLVRVQCDTLLRERWGGEGGVGWMFSMTGPCKTICLPCHVISDAHRPHATHHTASIRQSVGSVLMSSSTT